MIPSVSAVLICEDDIFYVKRQNYLEAFPGHLAFPGGKVDTKDQLAPFYTHYFFEKFPNQIIKALVRELKEEISFDLIDAINLGAVKSIEHIGNAKTPSFSPIRFDNYFYKIVLVNKVLLTPHTAEFSEGGWKNILELKDEFNDGLHLAVPPIITILNVLSADKTYNQLINFELPFDKETMIPMIEAVKGVKQFMPKSNTFPPANRTNCFLIGSEDGRGLLVDPSPKDENELSKLYHSLHNDNVDRILITHHHPDHHQFVTHIAKNLNIAVKMSSYTLKRTKEVFGANYWDGIQVKVIKEGDKVATSLGRDVLVYDLPGHDEGMLGLAREDFAWFIVSDLIQTVGSVLIAAPEGNMRKYLSSLEKVMDFNPSVIFPSHGLAVGGILRLKETLTHRMEREEQILDCLKRGLAPDEITREIYAGISKDLMPYAYKTLLCHLQKIREDGLSFSFNLDSLPAQWV